jgi:hypothetical protein
LGIAEGGDLETQNCRNMEKITLNADNYKLKKHPRFWVGAVICSFLCGGYALLKPIRPTPRPNKPPKMANPAKVLSPCDIFGSVVLSFTVLTTPYAAIIELIAIIVMFFSDFIVQIYKIICAWQKKITYNGSRLCEGKGLESLNFKLSIND